MKQILRRSSCEMSRVPQHCPLVSRKRCHTISVRWFPKRLRFIDQALTRLQRSKASARLALVKSPVSVTRARFSWSRKKEAFCLQRLSLSLSLFFCLSLSVSHLLCRQRAVMRSIHALPAIGAEHNKGIFPCGILL